MYIIITYKILIIIAIFPGLGEPHTSKFRAGRKTESMGPDKQYIYIWVLQPGWYASP